MSLYHNLYLNQNKQGKLKSEKKMNKRLKILLRLKSYNLCNHQKRLISRRQSSESQVEGYYGKKFKQHIETGVYNIKYHQRKKILLRFKKCLHALFFINFLLKKINPSKIKMQFSPRLIKTKTCRNNIEIKTYTQNYLKKFEYTPTSLRFNTQENSLSKTKSYHKGSSSPYQIYMMDNKSTTLNKMSQSTRRQQQIKQLPQIKAKSQQLSPNKDSKFSSLSISKYLKRIS
ncbi:hypothetical protein pb186bvf_006035 [Paramecium bursaria]